MLGSGVQAGTTKRKPTTEREREKKVRIEVYGEETKLLERP